MRLNELTSEAFHATVTEPVTDVTRDPHAALDLDIWSYVDQVLQRDYSEHDTSRWDVKYVYREAENRYQHVFIRTHRRRQFLVIVLEVEGVRIHGHYHLDMKAEYQ